MRLHAGLLLGSIACVAAIGLYAQNGLTPVLIDRADLGRIQEHWSASLPNVSFSAIDSDAGRSLEIRSGAQKDAGITSLLYLTEETLGIGVSVKPSCNCAFSVTLRDIQNKTHSITFDLQSGEWRELSFKMDAKTFKSHSGGGDEETIHFPIKQLSLSFNAKTPSEARHLIRNLVSLESNPRPETGLGIEIVSDPPGGVAFIGEKANYRVIVDNRLYSSRNIELHVDAVSMDGVVSNYRWPLPFTGPGVLEKEIALSASRLGYTKFYARATENGQEVSSAQSGFAVVRKNANYGMSDPESFFGCMHPPPLAFEPMERIGVKNIRVYRSWFYLARSKERDYDWKYLDETMENCQKHGMNAMLLLTPVEPHQPPWRIWKGLDDLARPENIRHWTDFVHDVVSRYKDMIVAVEICNEPDVQMRNDREQKNCTMEVAVDTYAELLKAAYSEIKAIKPSIIVSGLDVCSDDFNNNFKFSERVLEKAGKYLDVDSVHPYSYNRTFREQKPLPNEPEDYKMREKLLSLSKILSSKGSTQRLWPSELGWDTRGINPFPNAPKCIVFPRVDTLSDSALRLASAVAKGIVVAHSVPEVEKLFWFESVDWPPSAPDAADGIYGLFMAEASQPFLRANTGSCRPYPAPGACAYATCAFMLHHAKPVPSMELFNGKISCWRFERGEDGKSVFVLWTKPGEECEMLPQTQAPFETFDIFNLRIEPKSTTAGIPLGYAPVFVCAEKDAADKLAEAMKSASLKYATPIVVQNIYLSSQNEATAIVKNQTDKALKANIRGCSAKSEAVVEPGINRILLPLNRTSAGGGMENFVFSSDGHDCAYPLNLDALDVGNFGKSSADGDLTEAKLHLQAIRLDKREQVAPIDVPWNGIEDLSANAYFGWSGKNLYFAAEVASGNPHVKEDALGDYWKSDSIQIVIDSKGDALTGATSDMRRLGFVLGESDPKAFFAEKSQMRNVSLSISRKGSKTVYEAIIPWTELNLKAPRVGQVMRMDFIVNGNGEAGRRWIGLTPGIGEGIMPKFYANFIFK